MCGIVMDDKQVRGRASIARDHGWPTFTGSSELDNRQQSNTRTNLPGLTAPAYLHEDGGGGDFEHGASLDFCKPRLVHARGWLELSASAILGPSLFCEGPANPSRSWLALPTRVPTCKTLKGIRPASASLVFLVGRLECARRPASEIV